MVALDSLRIRFQSKPESISVALKRGEVRCCVLRDTQQWSQTELHWWKSCRTSRKWRFKNWLNCIMIHSLFALLCCSFCWILIASLTCTFSHFMFGMQPTSHDKWIGWDAKPSYCGLARNTKQSKCKLKVYTVVLSKCLYKLLLGIEICEIKWTVALYNDYNDLETFSSPVHFISIAEQRDIYTYWWLCTDTFCDIDFSHSMFTS